MADQSNDDAQGTSDDRVFNRYDTILFLDQFQSVNSSSGDNSDTTLLSSVQSSEDSFNNEYASSPSLNGQPTISSMPDDHINAELFPGAPLGTAHSFNVPVNEVTVTTPPSGVDENNTETVADTSCEPDLNDSEHHAEETSLVIFHESIAGIIMTVKTDPPASLRLRYDSDDRRRIPNSLTNPMEIDISNLRNIKLSSNQSFYIRLVLAARIENSSDQIYHHPNKLKYHSDDAQILNDGTICVPLTSDDINKGTVAYDHVCFY
ncbi:unnamed protein product [Adineta steineri]|uniref:Uncharacterized protein n=2 Tax=Adineta steineri TaxID=433720 RepID=A0A815VP59_9BILA|nr:unnamed protein product [Adineta steineri]CAF1538298.1 unnamed protein product [Adineta steineri]